MSFWRYSAASTGDLVSVVPVLVLSFKERLLTFYLTLTGLAMFLTTLIGTVVGI